MGVSLSVCRVGDYRGVVNKGVCEEAAGNNRRICIRDTNIQTLYTRRADGGVQSFPKVVGPRPWPQSDVQVVKVKEIIVYIV